MTVCFEGRPPPVLVPGDSRAYASLRAPILLDDRREISLRVTTGGMQVPTSAAEGACVRYGVDVAAAEGGGTRALARRVGPDLVLSHGLWLWRPADYGPTPRITARFSLPDGMRLSSPWPGSDDDGGALRVPVSTLRRRGYTALGALRGRALEVPGGTLDVVLLGGPFTHGDEVVYRWLEEAGRSVATLHGRFPRERVQVLVHPSGWGGGVQFGFVVRGGGPAVNLLVGPRASARSLSLSREWVAVHEMSHLAVPFLSPGDPWLSEGLATWYQNVLRARSGQLSEEEAWAHLLEGFDRGRAALSGRSLLRDGRDMYARGAFQRVYWAGTALVLLADVALRHESGGERSLDAALAAVVRDGAGGERGYSAEELCRLLDAASGSDVFTRVMGAGRLERGFPEVEPVLASLGVSRARGKVQLDDDAPLAELRRAIMRGPAR